MSPTEAIVAIIVALLSGGTLRSLHLYLKERRAQKVKQDAGVQDIEVTDASVAVLLKQIDAMTKAWDEERESYQHRDQMRRDRIAELEAEVAQARDRLAEAQRALLDVSRQVESLTVRLASLADDEGS